MNRTQYIKGLRNGMFADRPTINEAYEYAMKMAQSTGSATGMITAIHVLLNTIANDLEKFDEQEKARAQAPRQRAARRTA